MGTTPKFQIPYVEPADLLANYPLADKAQADLLEALLTNIAGDTGWIDGGTGTTVFNPNATNYLMSNSKIRVMGNRAQIWITGTMKVATTGVGTKGDITNLALGVLAPIYRPTAGSPDQGLTSGNGRGYFTFITGTGTITLNAVAGSVDVAIGESVQLAGTYLV